MKITEVSSFPYPVLAPWSKDINGAAISAEIDFQEEKGAHQVSVHCNANLDQPQIVQLIQEGTATFGCAIRCIETGMRRLQPFSFPAGSHEFAPGALLGNVYIRPMVWTVAPVPGYSPVGAHAEFPGKFDLGPGAILALGEELIIEITRPPLPTVESIFEMKLSEEVPEGEFAIDTGADRVTVRMGQKTYHLIQKLRQTDESTRSVVMNSLYVPMVMQVLQEVSEDESDQFEKYRWFTPFKARCEQAGIDFGKVDLLTDAQKLLHQPFGSLSCFVQDDEGEVEGATT